MMTKKKKKKKKNEGGLLKKSKGFSGVFTALVTPFSDGKVDETSFAKLVEWQLDKGVDGFVVNGTTAESPNLSWEEVKSLYSIVRKISGKEFPILLGTGSNSTQETVESTKKAEDMGASGALVVVPYYNKPPQRGIVDHFSTVANAVQFPILLYNVPARTIVSMDIDTIYTLSEIENIVGIKEATGNIAFGVKIREVCGLNFLISSGDDISCIELMINGGDGVVSVISHLIPNQLKELCTLGCQGNQEAVNQYKNFNHLNQLLGIEPNPMPVKMGLYLMGIIESPEMRLPMVTLSDANKVQLKNCLEKLEILYG